MISLDAISWTTVLPQLIVAGAALLVLLLAPFLPRAKGDFLGVLAIAGLLLALAGTRPGAAPSVGAFDGAISADGLACFLQMVVLLGSVIAVLLSLSRLESEGIQFGEYYALILLSTVGMLFLVAAGDLAMVFLGVELTSVPIYVLAGSARRRLRSNEAGLKYFLLGAFTSGLLLYGIALLYGATGTLNLRGIQAADAQGGGLVMYTVGAALVLVALSFKVGLVPFHYWAPDVYQGAPTPAVGFLSAGPKAAVFVVFVRTFTLALAGSAAVWLPVLWVLAALSMLVGNVAAIVQDDLKRLLGYSSIAHAGYIAVGLAAAAAPEFARTGPPEQANLPIQGVAFYLLVYALMNLGAFAVIMALSREGRGISIRDYGGLGFDRPIVAAAMTVFMLSLAGIPPLGGFLAKWYVFASAVRAGLTGLVVLALLTSVVSVYYYLRVVVFMYMRPRTAAQPLTVDRNPYLGLALALTAGGTVLLGLWPAWVLRLLEGMTTQLFG